MAEIAGYRSPVDLGLGRTPNVADREAFDELTQVYDAIHLLAAYLDKLRLVAEGGGSGQTPLQTMFFNRFYVSPALVDIQAGDVVSPHPYGGNGTVKGALSHYYASSAGANNFMGVALTSGVAGSDIRVGIGPAAIEVPGAQVGQYVYCYPSLTTGNILSGRGELVNAANAVALAGVSGGTVYPMIAGVCIAPGIAIVGKFHARG